MRRPSAGDVDADVFTAGDCQLVCESSIKKNPITHENCEVSPSSRMFIHSIKYRKYALKAPYKRWRFYRHFGIMADDFQGPKILNTKAGLYNTKI